MFNKTLCLFLSLITISNGFLSSWPKQKPLKDENRILLFVPRRETRRSADQDLAKSLKLVNDLGIESVEIRFIHGLERKICCFNQANYQHSDTLHFDQEVLIVQNDSKRIDAKDILLFCQNIPYERSTFKGMNFESQIHGANNLTPFHTTISNHPILRRLVCGMSMNLPESAFADCVVIVRFIDEKTKRRETLFLLQYENDRLKNDIELQKVLKSRHIMLGTEFGYFLFTEPNNMADQPRSDCYLYLEKFIKEKNRKGMGTEMGTVVPAVLAGTRLAVGL